MLMGGGFSGGGGSGGNDDTDDERSERPLTDYEDSDEKTQDSAPSGTSAGAPTPTGGGAGSTAGGVVVGGGGSGGSSNDPGTEEDDSDDSDPASSDPSTDDPSIEDPETEDDEDNEQEEKQAEITVLTDPWDNIGWGIEPVLHHLKQTFGENLEISYGTLPVRHFGNPDRIASAWHGNAQRHGMPTSTAVWGSDPPESNELSVRAMEAAQRQGSDRAVDYIRRLRIAVQVEGVNIEDKNLLIDLAAEVGLNRGQFIEDWENIEIQHREPTETTPVLEVIVGDVPWTWSGFVEYERAEAAFIGQQVNPEPVPQSINDFVREKGPVATQEVMEVFELSREEAVSELRESDGIRPQEFDCGILWNI